MIANRHIIAVCASLFLFTVLTVSSLRGQSFDVLSNAVVGIDVLNNSGENQENGTGFVVSVDRSTVTVLTARHLFYPGRAAFEGKISLTFFVDRHESYTAEILDGSAPLDLALLSVKSVPPSIIAKLPLIPVRPNSTPPSLADTGLRIFGGKAVDWQVATGAVSGGNRSAEGFGYAASGMAGGFSGSPVFDSKGLLLGVHLGEADNNSNIGRAVRMDRNVYNVLSGSLGVTMNRLNFNVIPNMPTPSSGGSPSRSTYDEMRQNTIDTMTARAAGIPETFGRIDVRARKAGKWQLTVFAWGRSVASNYYDVHLEAILKGVGNSSKSIRVSNLRLAAQAHKYTASVDELGKSAVVCFTGTPNMSSPRPQRLTAWFSIDENGDVATFTPSRPAALEPASENPCDMDSPAPMDATAKTAWTEQAVPEPKSNKPTLPRPSGQQSTSAAMDPANFAAVHVNASMRQQKWSLNVMALSGELRQRDTRLQVMVVDATDHLKALPVSKKTLAGSTYADETLDELGKGVVVCYTAIDDSTKGQAFRMTSWFATEVQGNRAKFVPVRPAVLTPASDAPCQ